MAGKRLLTRDRFACWICNFALERIASPWYRNMVSGSIRYGLRSAVEDEMESPQ
jgi:hypothetical protein